VFLVLVRFVAGDLHSLGELLSGYCCYLVEVTSVFGLLKVRKAMVGAHQ